MEGILVLEENLTWSSNYHIWSLSNRQNPMFVQPYDNWQGVDASGPEST